MFGLKPARRWQPSFHPFKREKAGKRILGSVERVIKGNVFGCRMCGNCLLQETAFICPMQCPKGMRNGPCGGITPDKKCYIDITRNCIWHNIYSKAIKTGRQERLLEILPPLDWDKTGCETWGGVINQAGKTGYLKFFSGLVYGDKKDGKEIREEVFRSIRQPVWWKGDSCYHPPLYNTPVSELESRLHKGEFVVTTEISPPAGSSSRKLIDSINGVKPFVTAINFTESSSASPKMSSLACCNTALKEGVEPVLQIAARDINRIGLQALATGLDSMGIKNVLCITGDNAVAGSLPRASMQIPDLDSVQMLWILRKMRDEGVYLGGAKIYPPPVYFLGAATSPFASEPVIQAIRDEKKVNAGAQFLQTNLIFEPDKLDGWLEQLDKRGVLGKVFILAGIAPLKSYKLALYLDQNIPGVSVPARILERMNNAGVKAQEEGIQITLELIERIKGKSGINGLHLMTIGWESSVSRIINEAGLKN